MPIDYKKYPTNWKTEIRPAILAREGNRCKFCNIENRVWDANRKGKIYMVCLTIAHLDHDITNNDYSNLAALCQPCHLRYDAEYHAKNSRETRKAKKQAATRQIDLFDTNEEE